MTQPNASIRPSIRCLGLDREFAVESFEELAENALCAICRDVIEDPKEVDCSDDKHVFCGPFINEAIRRRPSCPLCRGAISKISNVNPTTRNIFQEVKWKCLNFKSGCEFKGVKKELEKHLDEECEKQERDCPFVLQGCTQKGLLSFISPHKQTCPFRLVPCEHCKEDIALNAMDSHLTECKSFPVECTSGCGMKLPRGELPAHTKRNCPEATIQCPVPGCGETRKRKAMEEHEKDSDAMRTHINLVLSRCQHLEKKLKRFATKDDIPHETEKRITVQFPNYGTRANALQRGQPLQSLPFTFQGSRYVLSVYPKGTNGSQPGYAGLGMHKYSGGQVKLSLTVEVSKTGLPPKTHNLHWPSGNANNVITIAVNTFTASSALLTAARLNRGTLELSVRLASPLVLSGYSSQ
uniref:TRAF-type domain-containing protein n=1 Tax=Chromera velia CCMP2878 TaxID=1169474 RepID=A0A0G4FWB4_9ALVE|mmetsp:Transcript_50291/g.99032  ORF Transcript_50291/g.99032 Transcript_50291/m.99032 type:complete len:409 (+) Transcript_50291:181-1407(+)|eukprot:Cvel_499.t1-p1 / transcript=Cvel_499.t1 / gene=Cvel_499 / organism=Chromera_velia_CCMP2878 / gene_product=TNF receptor-associated factor family protein, putative / transcript_product=TNF receptor-associated factor family protein, putative / location=Cvel_scaffold15:200386-202484(+) / protein_length=408 / sequence_SO=supercontig / SO=protein_coding / is_pseudo=false